MSVLAKLEEIEARLKAATPGEWKSVDRPGWHDVAVYSSALDECDLWVAEDLTRANAALIAHSPADLALLARLVRSVAESECSRGCIDECEEAIAKGLRQAPLCHRCRIRRELADGGAK